MSGDLAALKLRAEGWEKRGLLIVPEQVSLDEYLPGLEKHRLRPGAAMAKARDRDAAEISAYKSGA